MESETHYCVFYGAEMSTVTEYVAKSSVAESEMLRTAGDNKAPPGVKSYLWEATRIRFPSDDRETCASLGWKTAQNK